MIAASYHPGHRGADPLCLAEMLIMKSFCNTLRMVLFALLLSSSCVIAKEMNLLPKYGMQPKPEKVLEADREFLSNMDQMFDGDRIKAANAVASRGWDFLRSGDSATAMRRFNQAWMLNPKNVQALWGMAAVVGAEGDVDAGLSLFREAETIDGSDIDLRVDSTRAMSIAAVRKSDTVLMKEALSRFEQISIQAPTHPMNWQNWAVALFYTGDYAGAWEKIAKMEKLIIPSMIDRRFIDALTTKMPRPGTE